MQSIKTALILMVLWEGVVLCCFACTSEGEWMDSSKPIPMQSPKPCSVGPFCFPHPSRAYVLPCPHLLQAVFQMQSVKCLKCQEENRVVLPCQHAVLCETCAEEGECPICHPNRPHALQS